MFDILLPYAVEGGKSFLRYRESNVAENHAVDKKVVLQNGQMMGELRKLQHNMSFKACNRGDTKRLYQVAVVLAFVLFLESL